MATSEFPKMLFRGTTTTAGRVEVEQRIVASEGEQSAAEAVGWLAAPAAGDRARDDAAGGAGDRGGRARLARPAMCAAAQAEAAAVEADDGAGIWGRSPAARRGGRAVAKKPTP